MVLPVPVPALKDTLTGLAPVQVTCTAVSTSMLAVRPVCEPKSRSSATIVQELVSTILTVKSSKAVAAKALVAVNAEATTAARISLRFILVGPFGKKAARAAVALKGNRNEW